MTIEVTMMWGYLRCTKTFNVEIEGNAELPYIDDPLGVVIFVQGIHGSYNFSKHWASPGNHKLEYVVLGLPGGTQLTIDEETGILSGTPGPTDVSGSPVVAISKVTDVSGSSRMVKFVLLVSPHPDFGGKYNDTTHIFESMNATVQYHIDPPRVSRNVTLSKRKYPSWNNTNRWGRGRPRWWERNQNIDRTSLDVEDSEHMDRCQMQILSPEEIQQATLRAIDRALSREGATRVNAAVSGIAAADALKKGASVLIALAAAEQGYNAAVSASKEKFHNSDSVTAAGLAAGEAFRRGVSPATAQIAGNAASAVVLDMMMSNPSTEIPRVVLGTLAMAAADAAVSWPDDAWVGKATKAAILAALEANNQSNSVPESIRAAGLAAAQGIIQGASPEIAAEAGSLAARAVTDAVHGSSACPQSLAAAGEAAGMAVLEDQPQLANAASQAAITAVEEAALQTKYSLEAAIAAGRAAGIAIVKGS